MKGTELVSVIIPAYNCGRYIGAALDSVFRQEHSSLEVIVVDDCSTDDTRAALEPYLDRIALVAREKNGGPAAARNDGVRRAQGSIIAFLDGDDLWTDDHLALLLPQVAEGAPYDYAGGTTLYFTTLLDGREERSAEVLMHMVLGASVYRANVFQIAGFFDETMRYGEDMDWTLRLEEAGLSAKQVGKLALLYRRHETNMTNSKPGMVHGQLQVARNRLERARAARIHE